jgi:TPR repeat protein
MRTLILLLALSGCATTYGEGSDLYKSGRYSEAAQRFHSCAQREDDDCMYALGAMHANGHIPGGRAEALRWWTLSARYNNDRARAALIQVGASVPPPDLRPPVSPVLLLK